MRKVGPEDYHIDKGFFTTCDGPVPSWKFSANNLDITLGEYATGKNALFYIKDVPVLYLPYILFPLKRDRQSGLLIPKIGTSSKKGFNFSIPYYLVISPSQDITVNLDIQSKRGAGTGVDYRYIRKKGSQGSFVGFFIYDTSVDRPRGTLSQKHVEEFSPTLVLKSDINYVSDHNYFRDYAEGFAEYNRKDVDSSVFITKHWRNFLLTPELRFTQNLEATSNATTVQKLPVITFNGIRQRIASTPLFFSLDSNFTNFFRETGLNGQRLELHPTVTWYGNLLPFLETSVWAGYRHRFYNTYDGGGENGFHDSAVVDSGASVSSTLARSYDVTLGSLRRLRHVVIPQLTYIFVPGRNQDRLPFFDYNDRIVAQNMIGWSLSNYLTGKYVENEETPVYRDLAYLRLSQGYDFSDTRRDLLTLYDELRPFTDLRVEAKVDVAKHLAFTTDSRFNPYGLNFSTANVATSVSDDRGNSLSAGYRFSRTQVNYAEGRLAVAIDPLVFNFSGRYSVERGAFLESYYSVEYKRQCWSVIFSYSEREGNKGFFVNFTLSGIGALSRMRAI
jgi:LPS-assembly protein